ncbi:MAG TPA: DNA repair protein RecO [Dehalococcoidia bacterium]|jgi:DNA repair protein RecO (recombination protein O)
MPQPPRVYKTPAIVLRYRKLGDTDKILTLYSSSLGKLDVVAKGVRKAKSRLAGHVEPLTQASFLLARGKSLDIVTQVETIESFQAIRDDLDRLSRAVYCCELLDKFTESHADNFALYRLLLDTLRRLATRGDLDVCVRYYEMSLLDAMGYRPELDECVTCRSRLEPVTNFWTAGGGGVVCPNCRREEMAVRPISPNAIKLMRLLLHGRFSDVARVIVDAGLASELERAMVEYVRWVLERDVRSAAFIDTVRRRRPARVSADAIDEPVAGLARE